MGVWIDRDGARSEARDVNEEEEVTDQPSLPATARPSGVKDIDWTRVLVAAEMVVGAVLVARVLARRPPVAPVARVTMGPGGWVSMKGGTVAVRRASRPFGRPRQIPALSQVRAPLWARTISAVPLAAFTRER